MATFISSYLVKADQINILRASFINFVHNVSSKKVKVKQSAPLQAWSGPEGSRKLRFPDFMTTAQDGGNVAYLTHRPPLLPENTPGTHFC
jgi:hypothetical protein